MGLPADKLEKMGESIKKIYDEPVDIVLGNHPSQNLTLEKREQMLKEPGTNPFIDKNFWKEFLDALSAARLDLLDSDRY